MSDATEPTTNRQRVADLRAKGWTYRAIAEELGISVQRVWQILKLIEREEKEAEQSA